MIEGAPRQPDRQRRERPWEQKTNILKDSCAVSSVGDQLAAAAAAVNGTNVSWFYDGWPLCVVDSCALCVGPFN